MNRLRPDRQVQVIAALVEGSSVRAVSRMTGVAKGAEAIDALTPDGYYSLYGIRGQGAGFEESEVDNAKRGGTALLSLFFPPEFSLEVKCIP